MLHSVLYRIKQVRGAAEFVCDENDQRLFLQIIKLNREAMVKYAYSVDCLFCDGGRHFEYDVSRELVVAFIHTPIFVKSLILLFVHIL